MRWQQLGSYFKGQLSELGQLLVLVVVAALIAVVVVDYTQTPTEELQPGEVAPRTVKAPFTFTYKDFDAYEARRQEARDAVLPVYLYQAEMADELRDRVSAAFAGAREEVSRRSPEHGSLSAGDRTEVGTAFRSALNVVIPQADIDELIDAGLSPEAEGLAVEFLRIAMSQKIIRDRELLTDVDGRVAVIELQDTERTETVLHDLSSVITPADARQLVSIAKLDSKVGKASEREAASTVARALVRPNFTPETLETEERRNKAAAAVPMTVETVRRGAVLWWQGKELTELDLVKYRALQEYRGGHSVWLEVLAIGLFLFLLLGSLYHYSASILDDFTTRTRDGIAVGAMLVLTAVLARTTVASSEGIAAMVGYEAAATSVWFMVPVAGAAIVVRLLVGTGWTVVFTVAAAGICGLVMDLQALPVMFFLLSCIAAAGAVEHTRERIAVLRAGVYTGLVNAAAVLLIHFLQLFMVEVEMGLATTMRPVWSMAFAFAGGVLSSFLVLGVMPAFEATGFVTDHRMMELANLNHPLLRQLMLRAPGSYHHSVLVGTLAEAACEAIGANALRAKVCAYFHDIGKTVKPQYFVENQQDGVNRHADLDPVSSAQVIIAHVVDGARMAREHKLPQPIVDNILMHHGDGLLLYFYAKAQSDGKEVDERVFRYPGPRPNSREAGVIMLADKVEAATRTIRVPSEAAFRNMIHRIINSVMADGQFSDCPLTFREIHTIADTFVKVLMGIYHQRIEYPQTADASRVGAEADADQMAEAVPEKVASVITLELAPPVVPPDEREDYESVENLPAGKR